MRTKLGVENREDWRCAFCCHVRTGTIFFGTVHLVLHVLALAIIAVVFVHPELLNRKNGDFMVSSVAHTSDISSENKEGRLYDYQSEYNFFRERKWNSHDINVGLALTLCTFAITVMMVYGAVKGKPSYLMPFFCLQVFDFCIASLTMIGYFSYMPDVRQTIEENPCIPFQKELLKLDSQVLSLLVLITFVLLMMVKAYFIGVVWACYKYLTYCNCSDSVLEYIDADTQVLLPPDYETATKDPKFFPSYDIPDATPPPPYKAHDDSV